MKLLTLLITLLFLSIGSVPINAQSGQQDNIIKPRMRVIIDNDFAGDPDGLFQLVHHLLSPSVEIRGIIGSHLKPMDGFDDSGNSAGNAVKNINEVLKLMNLDGKYPVYQGSNTAIINESTPHRTAAAQVIVDEAMRTDVNTPLYIVCGGGLTEIASAYLIEPRIAERITLVWIGGTEYPELATPPPGYTTMEYNTGIDLAAVRVIFNKSDIHIWQVPRNAYRQTMLSYSELLTKVKPIGAIGEYLMTKLERLFTFIPAETYIMGDNPLVLLTALQSNFEPDTSSSGYVVRQAPLVNEQGTYEVNRDGRNIRVYTQIDNRLMFDDLFAKLMLFDQASK